MRKLKSRKVWKSAGKNALPSSYQCGIITRFQFGIITHCQSGTIEQETRDQLSSTPHEQVSTVKEQYCVAFFCVRFLFVEPMKQVAGLVVL